jgi:hypothetical protein
MKRHLSEPLPPRLSMDAYLDFVEESFRTRDIKRAHQQKELEERITEPFNLGDESKSRPQLAVAEEIATYGHST